MHSKERSILKYNDYNNVDQYDMNLKIQNLKVTELEVIFDKLNIIVACRKILY
jgi:hypothetical protein